MFWDFVCDMHIFMGWFQRSKLSHLCVYPIVNWCEMKRMLRQPKQPLCCVKFTIKYIPRPKKHQLTPDKMEYSSNATVTRCRRPPMEKTAITDGNKRRLKPWETPPWHRIQCRSKEWSLLKCSRQIRMNRECSAFECWLKWIRNCFSERYAV